MILIKNTLLRKAFMVCVAATLTLVAGFAFAQSSLDKSQRTDTIATSRFRQKVSPPGQVTVAFQSGENDNSADLDTPITEMADVPIDDSGIAVVDVFLRADRIYQGLFCQIHKEGLFIPMGEFFGIIFFPIDVDSAGARGWFLQKENTFNFSCESGNAQVGARKYVISKNQYIVSDDEIYLHIDTFNALFPLNLTFNRLNQSLLLKPSALLSFEVMQNRINSRRIAKAKNGLLYPLRDLDYAAIAQPNLNVKFSAGHQKVKEYKTDYGSVSGIYRGDMLYMSSVLYGAVDVNGDEYGSRYDWKNFSYTGERVITDNAYLSRFSVGDVVPTQTPMGSSGSLERGIRFTNKNIFAPTNFDTQTFTGKVQPGWEVELYRNGQLIGFQSILEDGTYLFEDVKLLFGTNRFRIVMFGPEGQEEVKEEVINVTSTLHSGEVSYDVSVTENGVGVFDADMSKVHLQSGEDKGTLRTKGVFRVGVAPNLELRTGLNHDSFSGKERTVGSIGTDINIGSGLTSLDVGYSSNESTFVKAMLRGEMFDTGKYSMLFDQQFSEKYIDSTIKNSFGLGYNDSTRYLDEAVFSYGAMVTRTNSVVPGEKFRDKIYYDISGNFNINSDFGNLTNNISYQFFKDKRDGANIFQGQSTYYHSLPHGLIRGSINYGINDSNDAHFRSAIISSTYQFSPKTSTTLTVDRSFEGDERLLITNSWSHKIGDYSPFLTGSIDDKGGYRFYVGVGMNLGFEPGTFSPKISGNQNIPSGASCLVYEDKNYNNRFDKNDVPLENVTLKSIQSRQKVITDENGRGLFIHLPPMRSTDIEVDESTLSDTRLFATSGAAITPRKSKIYDLEYPIHLCGTIEGYIYQLKNDKAKSRPHIPVQAVDKNGNVVGEALSVSGGYFSIERLIPGTYSIRINPEFLEERNFVQEDARDVEIDNQGDTISRPLLFYGDKTAVAVLSSKFRHVLTLGEDVVLSSDFSNLDDETTLSYSQPAMLSLSDIESTSIHTPTKIASGKAVTASQTRPPRTAKSKGAKTRQRYALVVDVFVAKKTALRAIRFYQKKYKQELKKYTLIHNQAGDTHEVLIAGIQNRHDVKKLTKLFLCSPQIEKFDINSNAWIEITR